MMTIKNGSTELNNLYHVHVCFDIHVVYIYTLYWFYYNYATIEQL